MITIPYTKLHGAENDFLLTWGVDAPAIRLPEIARQICARTTGVGADGWMLVRPERDAVRTRLFNSDGSEPEMSGNGTRCAAAFAILNGLAGPDGATVITAAGPKKVRTISRTTKTFVFEMDMGQPQIQELHSSIQLAGNMYDATVLNTGNPQCAIFADPRPENWRALAAEAERHPRFPNRSNISFVRIFDPNNIDAVFFERGAGETRSSGTGSTGAAVAAIARGLAASPVNVHTPAGVLVLRWDTSVYLRGPAELISEGRFYFDDGNN